MSRSALEGRLLNENSEIHNRFGDMVTDTMESLKGRNITPSQLADVVMNYSVTQQLKDSESPCKSIIRIQREMRDSKRLGDAFFVLFPYYSFFNYELIGKIIERLGTDNIKKQFADYKEKFHEFCKRRVSECPRSASKEGEDDVQVTIKLQDMFENYTMNAVKVFHNKLCKLLQVPEHLLRFFGASEGCIELVFLLPVSVEEDVFPLTWKQMEYLKRERVILVRSGSYHCNLEVLDMPLTDTLDSNSEGFPETNGMLAIYMHAMQKICVLFP